jgi:hypothetical protein
MCGFLGHGAGPAIIAVIGTLGGAIIGGGITYFLQRAQREHDDRVRFHDSRLKAYAEFTRASTVVVAAADVWLHQRTGSLQDHTAPHVGAVSSVFPQVRLLGSKAVVAIARKVNQNLSQLVSLPPPENVQELKDATKVLQSEFEEAVRQELGTDRLS